MENEKQLLSKQVNLRVTPELHDFYSGIAKRERRKVSDVLRFIIEDHARELRQKEAEAGSGFPESKTA